MFLTELCSSLRPFRPLCFFQELNLSGLFQGNFMGFDLRRWLFSLKSLLEPLSGSFFQIEFFGRPCSRPRLPTWEVVATRTSSSGGQQEKWSPWRAEWGDL